MSRKLNGHPARPPVPRKPAGHTFLFRRRDADTYERPHCYRAATWFAAREAALKDLGACSYDELEFCGREET